MLMNVRTLWQIRPQLGPPSDDNIPVSAFPRSFLSFFHRAQATGRSVQQSVAAGHDQASATT